MQNGQTAIEPHTCPGRPELEAFLLGRVADGDAVDAHVSDCAECQRVLATLDGEDGLVRELRSGGGIFDPTTLATADRIVRRVRGIADAPAEAGPIDWLDPADRPGDLGRLGPYRVVSVIGRGGMGVVFRADDTRLPRTVALKVLLDQRCLAPEYRRRMAGEAAVLARLHHADVVQIFETGEHRGRPYIALEFVEGGTLSERVGDRPTDPATAAGVVMRLARAMAAAHRAGIIHRDLKPNNLLVDGAPGEGLDAARVKITDFGLARDAATTGLTETGAVLGTPGYMAPELIGSEFGHGPTVDVYSLGAILFQMLTGRAPFCGATPYDTLQQTRTEEPTGPRQLNQRVPRDLETICLKCLEKAPARRYATADDLADDLERYMRGEPIRARAVSRAERVWKWVRRRPALAGLVGVTCLSVVALTIGAAVYQWRLRQSFQKADANYRAARDALLHNLNTGRTAADGGVPQVRELHYQQALAAVEFFRSAAADRDAETQRELATVLTSLGQAAGNLGKRDEAIRYFQDAVGQLDVLIAADGDRVDLRHDRAFVRGNIGFQQLWSGRTDDAIKDLSGAVDELAELAGSDRATPRDATWLAKFSHDLGTAYRRKEQLPDARRCFEQAIRVHIDRLKTAERTPTAETMLADSYTGLGLVCWQEKRFDEAESAYRHGEERLNAARASRPNSPDAAAALGALFINWGLVCQDRGDLPGALEKLNRAVEVLSAAYTLEPKYARLWLPLRNSLGARSQVLIKLGRPADAARDLERGAEWADPAQQPNWRTDAVRLWVQAGQPGEAIRLLQRVRDVQPTAWDAMLKRVRDDPELNGFVAGEEFRRLSR
ncbi:MAG: protein kinase [Gemmataceae bacterium]|nr:protein kinase [Gemmataceae bacterium]